MTNEQALEFFNKVKGKKIRWSGWDKSYYFIPTEMSNTKLSMLGIGPGNYKTEYNILNGFNNYKSWNGASEKWILIEPKKSHLPSFL